MYAAERMSDFRTGRVFAKPINCLVYLPHSYSGRGPAESCVQIIRYFIGHGLRPTLFVGRGLQEIPATIEVRSALPALGNLAPWDLVAKRSLARLKNEYRAALETEAPGIAYFWSTNDYELWDVATRHGWVTVREMTNRTRQAAKISLDDAFELAGESRPHHITEDLVEEELRVLRHYDFVFSANDEVDQSLLLAGVRPEQILKTTFGYAESRFEERTTPPRTGDELVVGYLGTISIGKGVLDLIDAWKRWRGNGALQLAGPLDWSMQQPVRDLAAQDERVKLSGYVTNIEQFYSDCDIIVIPTLDEGGPQVTYEAAAAGSAIIATPMARGRMLEHERNALIVPCHDPDAILAALGRLADDPDLRSRLGRQAARDAHEYAYAKVGAQRARLLCDEVARP